jgi:hypothetical protein
MTAITATTSQPIPDISRRSPKAAGLAYVGAWIVGLTAFGTGPGADATNADIARYFADHPVSTAAQSLLIHGAAAVALYVVLTAVARTRASTRTAHIAGVLGVALSLVQFALGLWRSLVSTGSTTSTLVDVIDRVDGLKMLAFAVMIGASITALRAAATIGGRMAMTGAVATAALVVSGVAYAGAVSALLGTAAVSLVLLLTWVGHLGFAAGRGTA